MCDDRVIEPYFNVMDVYSRTGWGQSEVYHGGEHGGAKRWDSPIKDLNDLSLLSFPTITIDHKATAQQSQLELKVPSRLINRQVLAVDARSGQRGMGTHPAGDEIQIAPASQEGGMGRVAGIAAADGAALDQVRAPDVAEVQFFTQDWREAA